MWNWKTTDKASNLVGTTARTLGAITVSEPEQTIKKLFSDALEAVLVKYPDDTLVSIDATCSQRKVPGSPRIVTSFSFSVGEHGAPVVVEPMVSRPMHDTASIVAEDARLAGAPISVTGNPLDDQRRQRNITAGIDPEAEIQADVHRVDADKPFVEARRVEDHRAALAANPRSPVNPGGQSLDQQQEEEFAAQRQRESNIRSGQGLSPPPFPPQAAPAPTSAIPPAAPTPVHPPR